MITSLHITNFQSHGNSSLEFCPGVNVIVGESDSGKTAILRALRWLAWNRPGGDSFRSSWGGNTSVGVWLENALIVREKIKTENLYRLDDGVFKAFGTEVPQEIQDLLNIDEINFQQQLERPFLLDDSPGVVAAHFNKIAHLDSIDQAFQLVQKWTRQLGQDIISNEKRIEEYESALVQYDNLPEMEQAIESAEGQAKQINRAVDQCRQLDDLLMRLSKVTEQIEKESALLPLSELVNSAITLRQACVEKDQENAKLAHTIRKLRRVEAELSQHAHLLAAETDTNAVLQRWEESKVVEQQIYNLSILIKKCQNTARRLKEAEIAEMEAQQDFDTCMPDVCPLCGQEVK